MRPLTSKDPVSATLIYPLSPAVRARASGSLTNFRIQYQLFLIHPFSSVLRGLD